MKKRKIVLAKKGSLKLKISCFQNKFSSLPSANCDKSYSCIIIIINTKPKCITHLKGTPFQLIWFNVFLF